MKNNIKLFTILDLLLRKTDEEHGITTERIQDELKEIGYSADRKSVYQYIHFLEENCSVLGIDIKSERRGGAAYYKIVSRQFEIYELKLLADAVQVARFIPEDTSKNIIKNLGKSVSEYQADLITRNGCQFDVPKSDNKKVVYTIDGLYQAMTAKSTVLFRYFHWTADKKKTYHHKDKIEISPWKMVWNDEFYYLIGYSHEDDALKSYRIDKIEDLEIGNHPRLGENLYKKEKENIVNARFGMYNGEFSYVKLCCDNSMAGVIIDRFGIKTKFTDATDHSFCVTVPVFVSDQFYGWISSFSGKIIISSPKNVVSGMKNFLAQNKNPYK